MNRARYAEPTTKRRVTIPKSLEKDVDTAARAEDRTWANMLVVAARRGLKRTKKGPS